MEGASVNNVTVEIPLDLVKHVTSKSAVPAVEGFNAILTRILKEHDAAYPNSKHVSVHIQAPQPPTHFKTHRGFDLPIGLELFANWNGHDVYAKVTASGIEYKGKTYEVSPSAAAAKKDHGASDTTASTNGWKFWQFKKPDGRTKFIDDLRAPAGQK